MQTEQLGRYCGPSFEIGDAMCACVIQSNGSFLHRTSHWSLSSEDMNNKILEAKMAKFMEDLNKALEKGGNDRKVYPADQEETSQETESHKPVFPQEETPVQQPEADDINHEAFYTLISVRVCIPSGDECHYGTFLGGSVMPMVN